MRFESPGEFTLSTRRRQSRAAAKGDSIFSCAIFVREGQQCCRELHGSHINALFLDTAPH
jgi:hypothetical protein